MTNPVSPAPLMLYDGSCGFCTRGVQLMLRHDSSRALRFARLGGQVAAAVLARHPRLAGIDSMVWVERAAASDERVFVQSDAALRAARYLGGVWRLAALAYALPPPVRDALYAFVARHRHRLAPLESCALVSPADRARFLD